MDTAEQLRDKLDDPSTSMPPSLHNPDNLQGIYVYQLPFPGTLPEKAQREQLAAVVRKYSKIVEIRFDAVPNNPDVTSVQAGRRYQLPPLSRRALIVFQKTSIASYEALLAELNKQVMSQCHLSASTAKSEHISALIAMRNAASAGHNPTKAHQTMAAKNAQQNSTTATAAEQPSQQQQPQQLYSSKRPMTLLKTQPPAPAVKAFAMDSQTHTQPDPFHKNASRTLYVKHLDNTITEEELKVRYGKFGHILDIEVKNRNTMAPYAFIQFTNIESVANAIKAFNQQFEECGGARHKKFSNLHWWGNTIVTSRLWIGRLPPNCGEQYLMSKMRVVLTQPDDVTQVIYDAGFNEAIVMFVGHESTQIAFNKVKNRNITFQPERSSITEPVHHVHVDFCSEKLHDYFIDRLYGKNTESLLSDVILAPPPDPPKCLSSSQSQPKKSPSPPPDPSIESGGGHCASVIKRPIGRQKVLLVEQQQQNQGAGYAFEKTLPNCNAKIGRTTRETTHSNSMAEETQSHREKTTRGKSQENSERGRSANVRQVRSNSSSSNTSTDTYSQSPRKRWRHPPQPSEFNEFSGSRHKITTKKPAPETKHKWERKHRSQRSTERRRESRVEKREKRRERLRSRTRQTVGTARRTEGERSGEIASGGDRSKRGEHGGGKSTSDANKRSKTTSKVEKYKGRSNERVHTKTSSNSGSQLLPPPPVPPLRIDKTHDQHKRRRSTSSSSDSHSSCTCSSCSSNSSSNSRTNSLSENSDSELSSSDCENEAEQEQSSTRRSHRSRKDGFTDEPSQVDTRQPSIKRETPNAQPVHIKSEQVPLVTPIESTTIVTKNIVQNAERENEKIMQNETKEENTEKSKDTKGDEQSKQKDQTASEKDETAPKKTTAAAPSLPVQPPQTVGKVQVPRPSQRTVVCIPLDVQSTSSPPTDPRQMRPKQQRPSAVTESIMCLDLPRFVQKVRTTACSSNDRPSSSSISGEGANLTEELPKSGKLKTVPPTATDWIKHEPENAEMEPNLKIKTEESNDGDAQVEKKPTAANTLNLMASITERIKCVENGITEFRSTVQVEQPNASSNFAQIELEVSRIRTELTNGTPLELLEHSIAQRSTITAQMNTSADSVGRQLQPKTTGDGFQTSNGQEFVAFTDETEKNKRNDETEVGEIHDRRCSFLSEPDMPTRSFSLSCDHHPTTSSAKPMRLAHEKEQFASSANSLCASPLPKQSADSSSAFLRKPKQLADSQPNQTHARNTAGIPKLKEIKLDRKLSAVSLAVGGDPWTTTSVATSLSSLKKDKELKERREHRSDSVGHLPTTSAKDQRKELGVAKANVHLNLKKMTTTVRPQQKQLQKEERKTDSFVAFGGTSGGHSDEHKKQLKLAKLKHVETESASEAEKQHKKQKRKKRSTEQSTSPSSSDESLEESDMFNGIDIEEQKRLMKMIKSGIGFGLSMYDRVKRRSSQRPDDEQKKKTALEVLKTKHAKKRKEFSRVRLSSTSTDSEGNEYAQATTSTQLKMAERSPKPKSAEEDESDTSDEENGEQNAEENDDAITRAEKPKTHLDTSGDMSTKSSADEKLEKTTAILTIRRPEIAPRKPFMDERPTKEEGANSSPSSVEEESVNASESESEAEDGELDAGDRAIKKLKNVLSRYRKSSESSADEAKQFNEKLAKVISIATEGCQTRSSDSHSEKSDSSSDSSSSSESDTDSEPKKERPKGSAGMSKKLPSQKKVKHLSMEDVFGADSSEESSGERAIPPPPLRQNKVELSSSITKHKGVVNETIKKGIVVPKIKVGNKHEEAIKIRTEKEKAQNKSLLMTNEQGKRTRVSSVSSVSSVEQKRFKEVKSKPNAEKETVTSPPATTTTATSVRDRSKSDATALKTAHHQQKQMTSNKSGTIDTVERAVEKKAELDKKMKQQKPSKTTVGTMKVTVAKTTAKNSTFMKELAKRKIARNKEEKKLDKRTALKRASGTDGKDQTAKKAKKETKPSEEQSNHSKEKDKKEREMPKEKQEEEVELAKSASETASQCLVGVSNTPKSAEDNEKVKQQQNISDKMDNEETEQKEQEEQREEEEAEKEGMKGKTETDELLNIVAAKQMADNEFEIIDSGKVEEGEETKRKQKEIEEERERKKREKEEKKLREQEKKREEEEKEKRKKEEHEEQKKRREQEKKREEEEEQKKREEEEKEKRKKEEHEEQTKRREQEKKREEEEKQKRRKEELRREEEKNREEEEKEKRRKEEHEEQKKRREQQKKREEEEEQKKREEEEKEKRRKEELEEQKKRREQEEEKQRKEEEEEKKKREEREANEVPTEEDDEEEMEAELLRRMEERNEEEAAVASLGLQTKADLRQPQDTNQPQIDAIEHDIGWKVLERPSEKEVKLEKVTEMVEEEKEKNMEEKVEECAVEKQIKREQVEEESVSREEDKTANEEPPVDKSVGFKFETVERRASNESVDSHMAGVGNGFVEVDAEHLRQQKREQDALERLAEERRKTEETVKRMDETVDAVATNSALLQNQNQESTALIMQQVASPNLAQQQLTIDLFQRANQQQNAHQITTTTNGTFPQQREGVVVECDYYYPTNMAMSGQAQNQQQPQREAVVQTVPVNAPIIIQSQYIQQQPQHQQTVHSLQQQHFPLPSPAEDVLLTMSATSGASVSNSPVTTATTSYHPALVPTTVTSVHHQQQQQQQIFQHFGHGQLQQQQHFQQQPHEQQQQFPQLQQQEFPQQHQLAHHLQQQHSLYPSLPQQKQSELIVKQPQVASSSISAGTSSEQQQLQQQPQTMASAMIAQQRKMSDMKLQQQQHHQTALAMAQPIQQNAAIGQPVQRSPIVHHQQQGLVDRRLLDAQTQQLQQVQQHQHQQQHARLEQPQIQQRQQFQMQHIVQSPPIVPKQQQQVPSVAVTTSSVQNQFPQQVQQAKQQNVSARQRKAQPQQVPTTLAQQQKQEPNISGQYPQQQEQQRQQHYQQQQLQPDTLSAMSTTGLMDHQSLVTLYQHLRDQQVLHQAQQMPSISAAMIAAASASTQFPPATLSKWHSIVTPPSSLAQGGALEEFLRHGLLAPQASSFAPSSGRGAESVGTSAMAAPTSFDELFQPKMSNTSSSPRTFPLNQPQMHQQILANVPQRNAAGTNISHQQQQRQQTQQISGASALNKQMHTDHQHRQPHQAVQQHAMLGQAAEKQHQQQIPQQMQQQILQHPVHQQQMQQQPQIQQHQLAQQQPHFVHTNVPLQPPPQHILPTAEPQQHQEQVQQLAQQKMVKKQSSANKYPVLWQGQLAMKNADTLVQMHKVCGNESLVQQMNAELSSVNENGIPLLRINQRMRLEHTHLENLIRKMEREDNQLALICLPCGRDREDVVIQTQKMNISFIEYFSSKSAAGIVSSGPTQQPSAMVAHIFPPSDFSRMLLSRNAPDLLRTVESLNAGYLFVILTNK